MKGDEKKARAGLAALNAKPRLSDLRQDISRLESERGAIQARLAELQGNDTNQISQAERAELEHQWKVWHRRATLRRRICLDLWEKCSEVRPDDMTAQELWVSCCLANEDSSSDLSYKEYLGLEGMLQ